MWVEKRWIVCEKAYAAPKNGDYSGFSTAFPALVWVIHSCKADEQPKAPKMWENRIVSDNKASFSTRAALAMENE